jgi:DNA mismatch repair protein MutS2
VGFSVSHKSLERLEWPEILARLARAAETPQARARLAEPGPAGVPGTALFEPDAGSVRERLAETAEALALLEAGVAPGLSGVADLAPVLARARKGGSLEPAALLGVAETLAALEATARLLRGRAEAAPLLAARVQEIPPFAALRADIEGTLDPAGEVRDGASPVLAEARSSARRLAAEIQVRVARMIRDPAVAPHLSDAWFTVRSDRFVLPVRADARGSVRGIVHDASRSGTTLFVEPEALVEPNNRHKQAELAAAQEVERLLRELSQAVADAADEIEPALAAMAHLDLAFARARLARAEACVRPEVREAGELDLRVLRHPLIPADEAVGNDFRLGDALRVLVLSGPNAGGKTVAMKSVALAVLMARAGLFVPAAAPARLDAFDAVLSDIGDEQDLREHLSTFSAHMANLAQIVARADPRSLVVLDEVGVGTDPGEGAALAQAVLEALADAGARVVVTTHYNLLKEMADVDPRFANASVELDPETLAPTYRLRAGHPGSSSASAVAARMGMRRDVLERADDLLSREDRRLDALLRELAASRVTLERERDEARRLRRESEAVRAEYTARLEKLTARRDELYRTMRQDLDRAFREAHQSVASVVRELQRGGASARDAARARDELRELAQQAPPPPAGDSPPPPQRLPPIDWNRARPGDPVALAGGGSATLVALPDRRGRVAVRQGSARVVVPMELVGRAGEVPPAPAARLPREPAPAPPAGGTAECDLRGLRADEAQDRLIEALDAAAGAGRSALRVIHGIGTGALRRAVREHLSTSPYVARFAAEPPERGGEGATLVELNR